MGKKDKLKILACPANKGGCAYYRIIMPMVKLQEAFPDDVEVRFDYDPLDADGADKRKGLRPTDECDNLKWADVVMFQNIHNFGGPYTLEILKRATELGKFTHYDTDDLLTDLYKGHRLVDVYKENKLDEITKVLYANSDMVSVTQRKFAERIQPFVTKALVIIKNSVDYNLECWNCPKIPPPNKKHVRIGWAGGIHHEEDVKEFRSVAMGVNSKMGVPNITWNFFGRPPKDPDEDPKEKWQQDVWDNYEKYLSFGVKGRQNVLFHPAMSSDSYGHMFKGLDIIIAPLQMNAFNDSKSEIKAMEAGRYGIPLVASNVGCYDEIIRNGETGYLISPDNPRSEWVKVLTKLCKDRVHREELGTNLKKITDEYYDINKVVGGRLELYKQIMGIKERALKGNKYKELVPNDKRAD